MYNNELDGKKDFFSPVLVRFAKIKLLVDG